MAKLGGFRGFLGALGGSPELYRGQFYWEKVKSMAFIFLWKLGGLIELCIRNNNWNIRLSLLLYIVLYCQPERKETFPKYIVPSCLSPDLLNCSLSLCLFAIVHFTLICLLDRMSKRRVSFPGLIEQPPLFCKSSIHLIAIMGTSWGWSCAKLSLAFS